MTHKLCKTYIDYELNNDLKLIKMLRDRKKLIHSVFMLFPVW